MRRALSVITAPMLLAGACGPVENHVWLTDDQDGITINLDQDNELATPYVRGAEVNIRVHNDQGLEDYSGWMVVSNDPDVFRVDELDIDEDLYARCVAEAVGTAQLSVIDKNDELKTSAIIEVAFPDELEVLAHGPQVVDAPELQDSGSVIEILVGGEATFEIRYYDVGRRLSGNGVLDAEALDGIELGFEATELFEDEEWLRVTPYEVGSYSLPLLVDGDYLEDFQFLAVDDSQVEQLYYVAESTAGRDVGDDMDILALALDADAVPIYGVPFTWFDQDGSSLGEGDILNYHYDPWATREVTVVFGDMELSLVINASDEPYVGSSNYVGCQAAGGGAGLGIAGLAFAMLLVRRRCQPMAPGSRVL